MVIGSADSDIIVHWRAMERKSVRLMFPLRGNPDIGAWVESFLFGTKGRKFFIEINSKLLV